MTIIKTKKYIRTVMAAVYIVYTLFIFSNSLQDAAESGGRSMAVLEMIDAIIGSGILTEHIIRKAAHFTEFALAGLLGRCTVKLYGLGIVHAAFAGLLTAVTDETLQLFAEGRSSQLTDVWIDFAGYVCGIIVMSILIKAVKRRNDDR